MKGRFPFPVFNAPVEGGAGTPPAAGGPPPAPAPGTAGAPAQPPEGPLAAYWDAEKGGLKTDELTKAFAERDAVFTQHAERMKSVPAKPEEYKTDLPAEVKLPDGYEIKFDDAAIGEARTLLHGLGVPQEAFGKLLGIVVKNQHTAHLAAVAEHQKMVADEVTKMGGADAVKALHAPIETFLTAKFPPAQQAEFRLLLATKAGTDALTALINMANGTAMPNRVEQKPAPAPAKSVAERWYGTTEQRKAG